MPSLRFTRPLVLAATLAGCAGGESPARTGASSTARTEVLVSAAASLTDAFAEVASAFQQAHPGVRVILNLAGSSTLRAQILEGATADVFASANQENMDRVVEAKAVSGEPQVFARNRLEIAVPAGNPAGVRGLDDLARAPLRIGLCAEEVPCGSFARRALERAGVIPSLDTNEPDVRALLTKIELGELDAGVTYVTDVASTHGTVEGIPIPQEVNVVAAYPIAVLAGASNPDAARAFVAFVLSDAGRAVLLRYGFSAP